MSVLAYIDAWLSGLPNPKWNWPKTKKEIIKECEDEAIANARLEASIKLAQARLEQQCFIDKEQRKRNHIPYILYDPTDTIEANVQKAYWDGYHAANLQNKKRRKEMKILEYSGHLKEESDIIPYFEDEYYDYFDCGQGYYQDVVKDIPVKIGDQYYFVDLEGEVVSQKQDRGDRLYWIEKLNSVTSRAATFEEIRDSVNGDAIREIGLLQDRIDKLQASLI